MGVAKGILGWEGVGVSWFLRNYSGNVLWAAADFYGETTNMHPQILPWEEYKKYWCQADSNILIQVLEKKIKPPWDIQYEFRQIGRLIDQLDVQLMHVFQESNRAADWLADEGYREKKVLFFEGSDLPRTLRGIVRLDKVGMWNLREKVAILISISLYKILRVALALCLVKKNYTSPLKFLSIHTLVLNVPMGLLIFQKLRPCLTWVD